jgi:wyosine [tRNA(Phe)-imidazoG37] synthetase (radical SAM superfamily)
MYKYIFGPVPSRRLGLSLGVDIIPPKLCTLDCIYCEVGATDKRGLARKEYFPAAEILEEIRLSIAEHPDLDHITLSGSGEPTLNSAIGEIIRGIKRMTGVPVAVLTNGTLLTLPEVRHDLLEADIVSPSLDAVSPEIFNKIDRPHPKLDIDAIIGGIAQFRREYTGILWLEVLFVKDLNDTDEEIQKLKKAIAEINPDKIHINTVVRPPAEDSAHPVGEERLREILKLFGEKAEIIGVYKEKHKTEERTGSEEAILALLRRRAMTVEGIASALMMRADEIIPVLEIMVKENLIHQFTFEGEDFFQATDVK